MTQPMEHDWPPTMRPRRRRRERSKSGITPMGVNAKNRPIDGEVLEPELEPRIHRVEVTVHHRQRHSAPPAWIVPLAMIALLTMVSPYAFVVALVMIAVFATAHPIAAISVAGSLALVIVIGVVQRQRGVPF